MSHVIAMPASADLRGFRMHTRSDAEREGPSPKLVWLLNLRQHQEQEAQRHGAAVEALRALGRASEQVQQELARTATLAVELGIAIAREVVGDALDKGHFDPAPIVQRCLASAISAGDATKLSATMHPADLALVLAAIEDLPEMRAQARDVAFHADPRAARGTVRVVSGVGRLVYDPREVVERVCAAIRKETSA